MTTGHTKKCISDLADRSEWLEYSPGFSPHEFAEFVLVQLARGRGGGGGGEIVGLLSGPVRLPILFWGSLLELLYNGPQNPILIIAAPRLFLPFFDGCAWKGLWGSSFG